MYQRYEIVDESMAEEFLRRVVGISAVGFVAAQNSRSATSVMRVTASSNIRLISDDLPNHRKRESRCGLKNFLKNQIITCNLGSA